MHAGMAGGGVIGIHFSIRDTTRPRERAPMLKLNALVWLWLAGLVAWGSLMPRP